MKSYKRNYNNYCIQNNQGQGRGYQLKPKAEANNPHWDLDYSGYHKNQIYYLFYYTLHEKKEWKLCFGFFIDSKQHEAHKLDMITLRNHALRSYVTWLPLSVLDMIIV